ncbi:16687_t:CDS:2 [Cetraspora pellucida]|uniref:16687_t:CDS:1 n=1 Tax=Cetraspora pellucida TaxID=1433469 RepID=A0A9N9F3C6_9GLOM|nr:16687_t:CDS:2 [Cetraspora pellucida]
MERFMSLYEKPLLDRNMNEFFYELLDENLVAETSFLNSLDRLTVDMLCVLCKAEMLPSVETKKLGKASEHASYVEVRLGAVVHIKKKDI